jgi:hypothetical protein
MDVKCPGCFHITTVFSHAQVIRLDDLFILSVLIEYYCTKPIFNQIFRLLSYAPDAQPSLVSLLEANAGLPKAVLLEKKLIKFADVNLAVM